MNFFQMIFLTREFYNLSRVIHAPFLIPLAMGGGGGMIGSCGYQWNVEWHAKCTEFTLEVNLKF